MLSEGKPEYVIEKYKSTVYGIAVSHTGSKFDADDIFQNVFLAYFSKKRIFLSEDHRKAWLIRTTLNFCKKHYNEKTKDTVELNDEITDSDFKFELDEENKLYSAILSLPYKYRTAIYLTYFEDMKSKEIAGILKISEDNVRMILSRARAKIKKYMEEHND